MTAKSDPSEIHEELAPQLIRGALGGVLMGLANLVPGISGGTMLLAAGVYPQFIEGVAEVTTLRFHARTLVFLGCIGGAAAVAIVLFAGLVRGLVIDHRWVMFSLFIGLTLGGVPVVWRLVRPMSRSAMAGCVAGIVVMAAMAMVRPGASGGGEGHAYLLLFVAGAAGVSAMILPGVSGGYLLLILGQYLPILGAIDDAKTALLGAGGNGPDWARLTETLHVFVPLGLGLVAGTVGVSNLMKFLLARFEKATLGVLLGLLLGAVLGLWPFQRGAPPQPGAVIKGQVMTPELIARLDPKDYPLETFPPTAGQAAAAAGLVAAGFLGTQTVAMMGGRPRRRRE